MTNPLEGRCCHMGFLRHMNRIYSHVLNVEDDNAYFFNEDVAEPEVLMTVTSSGDIHVGDKKYAYRLRMLENGWKAVVNNDKQEEVPGSMHRDIYDTEKAVFLHLLKTYEILG